MADTIIKVLWVEDDPTLTSPEAYPLEAEGYGIFLEPFCCWDEAEKELNANYDQWDAVILDAKCKKSADSADNASAFLVKAQNSLTKIVSEHNRQIPWYILSGGSELELNDLILDVDSRPWDKDRNKKYYSKNTDRELLYKRVRIHVSHSNHIQLRNILFKDVFDAIAESNLNPEMNVIMEDLLEPLCFNNLGEKDYNNRIKDLRRGIEYIFRSMIEKGILPSSMRTVTKSKDEVNLSWSSKILAGVPDSNSKINVYQAVAPRIISENIKNIIYSTGSFLHTTDDDSTKQDIYGYLGSVGNTSYLIRSYSYQMCDILLWYNWFLSTHPDPETNKTNWSIL